MSSNLECPKCNKKTLVERRNGFYQCLSCDFRRDLSDSESKDSSGFVWFFIAALTIALVSLGGAPADNAPSPQGQSPGSAVQALR